MDRHAIALAALLLLAGCAGAFPGAPTPMPVDVEPRIVGTTSTGGQCVDQPTTGQHVESVPSDGVRIVTVESNVTVPGAHYVIDEFTLSQVGDGAYRLDVNTTIDDGKPARACSEAGIVHYTVTMEVPAVEGVDLEIRHDGTTVARLGSGES